MALNEKNVKAIEADRKLQGKLKELWGKGAPVSDFYDLLSSAGLEVTMENLEDIHAELQRERGEEIAGLEKVDLEQLAKVAGGGTGVDCTETGNCDEHFKEAMYQGAGKCEYNEFCDQYLSELCYVNNATLL